MEMTWRRIETSISSVEAAPKVEEQFEQWFESRIDRAIYRDRGVPYPVYVIAAEGSGMYAAYHTAGFLAQLQNQCRSFGHHLFAISSVSGGSLGAAFFSAVASQVAESQMREAITDNEPCGSAQPLPLKPGQSDQASNRLFSRSADSVFGYDFLSPLFAGMLFPDFLQRFVPYPIAGLDRSRPLGAAFEGAWDDTLAKWKKNYPEFWRTKTNILGQPYLWHWRATGSSPALLLNATDVSTGQRRVIAPFLFAEDKISFLPIWNEPWAANLPIDKLARNIPLSTAAILSARFPWLTPAGWFYDVEFRSGTREPMFERGAIRLKQVQLVDGGYFDNSGVVTALCAPCGTLGRPGESDSDRAHRTDVPWECEPICIP
jgi:hypothetical protein